MTSRRITLILLSCMSAVLFLTVVGRSQDNPEALVKRNGWDVVALRRLKLKTQSQVAVDGAAVNVAALLVPQEGILFEDTAYYLNVNGNRTLHASPMNAYGAARYDVNGRVFCYTIFGPGVAITQMSKTEKQVAALGCESHLAFYDQDGDGKFETLVPLADRGPFSPQIPSWVRR
jgi:hypothetical protein